MELTNESGLSWLEAFRDSNLFDLITIILGIILVISFLVYTKKAQTRENRITHKIPMLSITVLYIAWLLIGLSF